MQIFVYFSSTCFGRIRPSSGALDVELQHTHPVCGWVVVLRAAAWVVCTVWMVPCDSQGQNGACAPEPCRAENTSINYLVASSWHFRLFHDEDAGSNNPRIPVYCVCISGLFRKILSSVNFYIKILNITVIMN